MSPAQLLQLLENPFGPAPEDAPAWSDEAACTGRTNLFFAPHAERPQARLRREARARVVCAACPVAEACRTYAREHHEYGFWGGESEEDRIRAGYAVPDPSGSRARRCG